MVLFQLLVFSLLEYEPSLFLFLDSKRMYKVVSKISGLTL